MHTILQNYVIISLHFMSLNMILLELLACGCCWCKLVHPLPMLTVVLPMAAVWLGCPSLGTWLGIF
jgi:hypothetical protein